MDHYRAYAYVETLGVMITFVVKYMIDETICFCELLDRSNVLSFNKPRGTVYKNFPTI